MSSERAKLAGKKVVESLGKGEAPVLGAILREVGYSDNTADTPKNVTETESFKSVVNPFVDKMIKHREKMIAAIDAKDLSKEKHRDLVASLDTFTKNIQLLSGGETERASLVIQSIQYGDPKDTSQV